MSLGKVLLPVLLLPLLMLACLFWGTVDLSFSEVWRALLGQTEAGEISSFIVLQSRMPQMLTAVLAGCALSVSGLVMQTVFSNPLADPSILGVSAGASLGAAVAMLLWGGSWVAGSFVLSGYLLTVFSAFVGAMVVIFILLACSALLSNNLLLLVTGVMISFATSSLVSLLSFFATAEGVRSYVIWGLGDFSGMTLERLPAFALVLVPAIVILLFMSKPLNALLLGNDYAVNLGVSVRRVRVILLFLTGLLTATVTALCGPISFIGLAVPHIARLSLRSANHRLLLPMTLLWGADIALGCQLVAHLPGDRGILPLNAITPLLGVPVVLFILFRRRSV